MLLTACIVARNEEANIGPCIQSLNHLVDEIVLVDTGSVDNTVRHAQLLGARVYVHPWEDDFSLHRNQALDYANGTWVLMVDADERLMPDTDLTQTRNRLNADSLPNLLLVRHWSIFPGSERVLEYLPRLIRRSSGIRYVYPIHEQLTVNGDDAMLSNLIFEHDGYADHRRLQSKHERNLRIASRMPDAIPHKHYCRMRSLAALSRWTEAAEAAAKLLESSNLDERTRADALSVRAAEALSNHRDRDFKQALADAVALDPGSPDIAFLEAFAAVRRYVSALQIANRPGTDQFLRIGQFWRMGRRTEELLVSMASSSLDGHWTRGQLEYPPPQGK